MSQYLVKSIKWTKNDGIEKWWGPNESGYTPHIYQAGVYTKEQADQIEGRCGSGVAKAILIDEKIMEKGLKQLENIRRGYINDKDKYLEQAERCEQRAQETIAKTIDYMAQMKEIEQSK